MNEYGTKHYWDTRYVAERGKIFDWLLDYEQLQPLFLKHSKYINKKSKILNVGCGNGIVTEQMYDDGYKDIVNIDISEEIIKQMNLRNKDKQGMIYLAMDGQKMDFESEHFDVVFDKGTIDGIMTSEQYILTAHKVISEVFRVLKTGGIYIVVSYASSATRRYLFERKNFKFAITQQTLSKDNKPFYVYLCVKTGPITSELIEYGKEVMKDIQAQLEEENKNRCNKISFDVSLMQPRQTSQHNRKRQNQSENFEPFDPFE